MDVTHRIEAFRAKLVAEGHTAFVARSVANVTYLTGFDGVWDNEPSSLVLITSDDAVIVTDSRFTESAGAACTGGPFTVCLASADTWELVAQLLAEKNIARVAVESSLPWAIVERLRTLIAAEVVPVGEWVEQLRCVKDSAEIERTAKAQALTDAAFDHILGFVREGMTENQIALELEVYMRSNGSEGVAFAPIVASGPNSALPHAHPGERRLQRGEFLKMDFGARVGGYCADMTRTVVMGAATQRHRDIYDAVRAANQAGIEAVSAGKSGIEIDSAARTVIADRGFGQYFGHGLGHGVGLEIHEAPSVGPRATAPVPEGSIITIEPGIYIPGFGGVRIEDLIVVERCGARVLTRSTKDLIEL